jgi:hypothetical protein
MKERKKERKKEERKKWKINEKKSQLKFKVVKLKIQKTKWKQRSLKHREERKTKKEIESCLLLLKKPVKKNWFYTICYNSILWALQSANQIPDRITVKTLTLFQKKI